jgi:NTP pyrophosphatase (non-canonical NTP hydrolase)
MKNDAADRLGGGARCAAGGGVHGIAAQDMGGVGVNFAEYQEEALRTAAGNLDLWYALSKLTVESGEALQLLCKDTYHYKTYTREMMADELGDVLWYLALAAQEIGVTLDEIAAANIAKLRARHGETYNAAHYTGGAPA